MNSADKCTGKISVQKVKNVMNFLISMFFYKNLPVLDGQSQKSPLSYAQQNPFCSNQRYVVIAFCQLLSSDYTQQIDMNVQLKRFILVVNATITLHKQHAILFILLPA